MSELEQRRVNLFSGGSCLKCYPSSGFGNYGLVKMSGKSVYLTSTLTPSDCLLDLITLVKP